MSIKNQDNPRHIAGKSGLENSSINAFPDDSRLCEVDTQKLSWVPSKHQPLDSLKKRKKKVNLKLGLPWFWNARAWLDNMETVLVWLWGVNWGGKIHCKSGWHHSGSSGEGELRISAHPLRFLPKDTWWGGTWRPCFLEFPAVMDCTLKMWT